VSVQLEIGHVIDTLRAGIGMIPPVLIAIALLGGPTAGWLLYRFVVQPRTRRMRGIDPSTMWVCPSCRSINAMRLTRCYRCDSPPIEEELEVVHTEPTGPVRLAPVGPGLDLGGPSQLPRPISRIERASEIWVEEGDEWKGWRQEEVAADRAALPDLAAMTEVVEEPGRRRSRSGGPTPVGPGRPAVARPAVVRPRRAIAAGERPGPDGTPAA
jgi:hypothetical protein